MTASTESLAGALPVEFDQYHAALASMGEGIITTDAQGYITFMNSVAQLLTGWTQAKAVGMAVEKVFNLANRGTNLISENPITKAQKEVRVVKMRLTSIMIGKTKGKQQVDGSAAPIFTSAGEPAGAVVIFRDATESAGQARCMQLALDDANDLVNSIRTPFLTLDGDLRVVRVNAAFCEAFSVSKVDVEGFGIYELNKQQWDAPTIRDALDEVQSGRRSTRDCCVEMDFPRIGRRIIALNVLRLGADDCGVHSIMLTFNDIIGGRRSETCPLVSEVSYKRLFESAKDGIIVLDAKTLKISDANQFLLDLLGYSVGELLGKELWEIGFVADKSASQSVGRELQDHGYVRYRHLPLETKDGKCIDVEVISNIYSVNQHAVAQCNIRDISVQSRMERKLQEQTDALAELHSRKDEFLAMLSHELRNPLAPMANAVRLLKLQCDEDPVQGRARGIIERQLTQLTRLVDDLMEVSRITTGRVLLRNDVVAVSMIIENAVETVRHLMDLRRHQLRVSLSPQVVWVYADAARLEQVFVNLLTNAAKYTEEGGHVTVTLEQEGEDCVVRIRDTGVGIGPELLPHVFDLFTQAELSLDRSRGGLGVGLALVRSLVEMHGGRVDVRSVEGKGSEFVVRIPAVASPAPQPFLSRSETNKQGDAKLRVLVVDDNLDTAESMSMLVETVGHDVLIAHEGNAALQAFREFKADVVLLDIGLPGLTGYEVAACIRAQETSHKAVLVAITGYGQESDRQLALAAGFDHHLVKPVDFDKVIAILRVASESGVGVAARA
ncbi:PAS domain-containing hybrid sensor histidine kinase/response regulator [Caballeronia sordidicola]|uniref:histidine kinase n=1 Tax=Caballeronia sordidicola TaxID=196367 RepID=A0A242MLT0_CABSO|nr:ATP-binding protein [Caballeronia sordidicola]OTP72130.1 Chemotaxis protein methyltransferase CheR [Caballeronia sordidicola]